MGKVIDFNSALTYLDIDAKDMVQKILDELQFDTAIMICWDGQEMTFFSSTGKTTDIVYSLEMAKKQVLDAAEQ